MCQVIFLASVEPLPESDVPQVRPSQDPAHRNPNQFPDAGSAAAEYAALVAALPEARFFYQLGGCQCHFRHYSEAEIADTYAGHVERGDQPMAESTRAYYEGVEASVTATADYLAGNLSRTPIWVVWKWEGDAINPECERWTRTPAYFRRHDFTMPENEGVIAIVPDGTELPEEDL